MKISVVTTPALLALIVPGLQAQDDSVDLSVLGENSLEMYDFTHTLEVDASDKYTLTMMIQHTKANVPVGDADTCVPLVKAPEDGLDYLAFRWAWDYFDSVTQQVTGFNHLSIDYNACGHPPEGFMQAHYDFHLYLVTPEYRATDMVCPMLSTAPICDPAEQEDPFFQVARSTLTSDFLDMPAGFEVDLEGAVPHMGLHLMDPQEIPATRPEWVNPVLAYCTFDSKIVAFEPMFPFHFNHGTESQSYKRENIEAVEPSIATMPTFYSLDYNADTGATTVVVKGKSAITQAEWEALTTEKMGGSGVGVKTVSSLAFLAVTYCMLFM